MNIRTLTFNPAQSQPSATKELGGNAFRVSVFGAIPMSEPHIPYQAGGMS